ncbi:hypothetical protein Plim_3160 [Planctopirus limnophila DSM 3776]|jgi:hypothetical protein|uniref:Uncharacterized protein n=3 Tax=Planctopirus TaxID=1649480 RepID=D5STE6_PLAL2|nr:MULTISPECIES: hypothetical protein [Planctopirus]ADG68975.1 hypothetical protein Plim_3160 [Planctopirus limnophila DSM 3776]ODA32072.1 hypothetical protein A6X21_21385 [Planctopirus hydrillae]QDV31944.1 hypothetical protein Spb1_38910 [Planctopirus ephydatiae]
MLLAEIVPTWYLLPLAMVISLVYSASRYELPDVILRRAFRLCVTILTAMLLAFAVLWILSYKL